jgi:hypothetical protein
MLKLQVLLADSCARFTVQEGAQSAWAEWKLQEGIAFPTDQWGLHNATAMWDLDELKALGAQSDMVMAANAKTSGLAEKNNGLTPLHVLMLTTSIPYTHTYTDGVSAILCYLLSQTAYAGTPFPQTISAHDATPLMWVSYDGQVELVRQMLEAGTDPNQASNKGRTSLHHAAICDYRCALLPDKCSFVEKVSPIPRMSTFFLDRQWHHQASLQLNDWQGGPHFDVVQLDLEGWSVSFTSAPSRGRPVCPVAGMQPVSFVVWQCQTCWTLWCADVHV